MLVRSNATARGHSAVILEVLEAILALLRRRLVPVIPLRGTVCASGDLMPLAYIAGVLEGNPDIVVRKDGTLVNAKGALAAASLNQIIIGPKEAPGLVNATAPLAPLAARVIYDAHQLAVLTQALIAMAVKVLLGNSESFHPFIEQGVRNGKNRNPEGLAQNPYALRSAPQWIGPQLEDLMAAHQQVTQEFNSSADNPLVDADPDVREVYTSFTANGIDINIVAYMSELAFLASPVSSHVRAAEVHNQSINSLAFLSARMIQQAVELVSFMGASRLDIAERFDKICEAVLPVLLSVLEVTASEDDVSVPLANIRAIRSWKRAFMPRLAVAYQNAYDSFQKRPNTTEYIGVGPHALYNFVWHELQVPFHLGVIDHPVGFENYGDAKRTRRAVGSWISIIYEAILEGKATSALFEAIEGGGSEGDGQNQVEDDELNNKLINGAIKGDEALVKSLLEQGADPVKARQLEGGTSLHGAAQNGHASVVKLLLDHGSDASSTVVPLGWTVMHSAALGGDVPTIQLLLGRGADISAAASDGNTPLHIAADKGRAAAVLLLLYSVLETFLQARAADETSDSKCKRLLRSAALADAVSTAIILLENGITDGSDEERGFTALDRAAAKGHETIVKLLLEHGSDVLHQSTDGWTALMTAAQGGHEENDGSTALIEAAAYGHEGVVKLVLENGANVSAKGANGSAFAVAVRKGHEKVLRHIFDLAGYDESVIGEGPALMSTAAANGNHAVMKLLLERDLPYPVAGTGAIKTVAKRGEGGVVDVPGWTPLHVAASNDDAEMVRLNLEYQPTYINQRGDGLTPLHIAAQKGFTAVVRVLLGAGADVRAVAQPLTGHARKDIATLRLWSRRTRMKCSPIRRGSWPRGFRAGQRRMPTGTATCPIPAARYDSFISPLFDHVLLIDGRETYVTHHLYSALQRFRKSPNRAFWIDQICINQSNHDERPQQVAKMSTIYTMASSVWIWLGEEEPDSVSQAITLARMVLEAEFDEKRPNQSSELERLLNSKQIWKYEAPGKSHRETWWPLVSLYSKQWFSQLLVVSLFDYGETPTALQNLSDMRLLRATRLSDADKLMPAILAGAIRSSRFGCTDQRDRIYGFLGLMAQDPDRPVPSYKLGVSEIYKQLARYFVTKGWGSAPPDGSAFEKELGSA
ncbi:hypothetical protein DL764_009778 [Monosporascus ibericus]|uniref:Heterokaryon incompatibility domain-containing protein n=1 Tax=Monosporascus ibericus TaxID=155417 RepID=A0A4Q4SWZ4_9PEZI|nr:hypothetical protein DL764_009778 [Monosporascus ibericus]